MSPSVKVLISKTCSVREDRALPLPRWCPRCSPPRRRKPTCRSHSRGQEPGSGTGTSAFPPNKRETLRESAGGGGGVGGLRAQGNRETLQRARTAPPPERPDCETKGLIRGREGGGTACPPPAGPAQHASLQEPSGPPPPPLSPHPVLHPQHTLFPPPSPLLLRCASSRSDDVTMVARATGTDKSG